jgi:hypothetical protein
MALAGLSAPLLFGRRGEDVVKDGKGEKKKMIAKCGLTCSECPAYIATQNNDDALRAETAKKWSTMFKADIQPADINCDGCQSESRKLFSYCNTCEIRKCARERKLATCAGCPDYSCEKLDAFLANVPEARATLEGLRQG